MGRAIGDTLAGLRTAGRGHGTGDVGALAVVEQVGAVEVADVEVGGDGAGGRAGLRGDAGGEGAGGSAGEVGGGGCGAFVGEGLAEHGGVELLGGKEVC